MSQQLRWDLLAEEVVNRRHALGWNQQQLSVKAKISPAVLSKIENNRYRAGSVHVLSRLQTALCWERGSVQDILAGGKPSELGRSA